MSKDNKNTNLTKIYTDGSCVMDLSEYQRYKKIGKKYYWDWWIWCVIIQKWKIIGKISQSFSQTTNNQMELYAIIQWLRSVDWPVRIYSDSQYAIRSLTHKYFNSETYKFWFWWHFPWREQMLWLKNSEFIQEALSLMEWRKVQFTWVRGHNGNEYNELADELSVQNNHFSIMELTPTLLTSFS